MLREKKTLGTGRGDCVGLRTALVHRCPVTVKESVVVFDSFNTNNGQY